MNVVGSPRATCRGRLRALAVVAFALSALVLPGASSAAAAGAKGIDVSNWQGTIKWGKVAAAGYRFVFGKATEGTSFVDKTYAENRGGSEDAGLVFGAYHFARPSGSSDTRATASAIAQADYLLGTADPQPGELPPVLDLEVTGGLGPKRLVLWTEAWAREISARLGVEPFVYSSPDFWQKRLGDSTGVAATAHLWIAHWTRASQPSVPAQNWNGQGWTFWQWTDCLSVPGINHCTDGDRMNGTKPGSAAIQPYATGAPVVSTPPSVLGPPEAGKFLAGVPGTWAGGKPLQFSYQWLRCDAAGANCLDIDGATHEWYVPASADVGHSLRLETTATAPGGSATASAAPTSAVSPAGTPPTARPKDISAPEILGTAQVGQVLGSSVGTWTGAPTKFAYRWRRCNAAGGSCVAIANATQASYTLTPDDIGSTISLLVTATGAGGAASASAAEIGPVAPAPLPPVATGSQTVEQGIAGNVQTDDARALVTWQPGAVPVGLTVSLTAIDRQPALASTGVALTVPNLPASGFAWPLDLAYAQPQPQGTVLGYSTDGKVYDAVPLLKTADLPKDDTVGAYVDSDGLTHVLTRTPLDVALFQQGAWGDPSFTSPKGPTLAQIGPVRILERRASHSVLVLARISAQGQARLAAAVLRSGGGRLAVLGSGSRFGPPLAAGKVFHVVRTELDRPGTIRVRLRLNERVLLPGRYRVQITAVDPWGRRKQLVLRFRYP